MRRVVVKVGTHVLSEQNRLCKERILNLVTFLVALMEKYEVILVSSGAVAAGYSTLKLDKKLLLHPQILIITKLNKEQLLLSQVAQSLSISHFYSNTLVEFKIMELIKSK